MNIWIIVMVLLMSLIGAALMILVVAVAVNREVDQAMQGWRDADAVFNGVRHTEFRPAPARREEAWPAYEREVRPIGWLITPPPGNKRARGLARGP